MNNNKLSYLKISRTFNDINITLMDSIIAVPEFIIEGNYTTIVSEGVEQWSFITKDDLNLSNEIRINITTQNNFTTGAPVIKILTGSELLPNGSVIDTNYLFKTGILAVPKAGTNTTLTHLVVINNFDGVNSIITDSIINTDSLYYINEFRASATPGDEYWKFTVFANNGESSFIYFFVSVQRYMEQICNGILWNSIGPSANIWNLVLNESDNINADDSITDMVNTTTESENFYQGWQAKNYTKFKLDNSYDFENATIETAIDAYSGGTILNQPKPYTYNVGPGSIYISRIRTSDEYAVIKVTAVENTSNDDIDKIEFIYKKYRIWNT
ncbi:MAG: hypothetical protein HY738_18500 [Bacteroidia bacterium]|nr:hypothetical protein [Bacteroidia bacterium]